jgi:hypothetical protein
LFVCPVSGHVIPAVRRLLRRMQLRGAVRDNWGAKRS